MEATITTDRQRRILSFDATAEQMFRYATADVIGRLLDSLVPERLRPALRANVERFAETREASRSLGVLSALCGLRSDGEEFLLEASISQVGTGADTLFTLVIGDVSGRDATQTELMRLSRLYSAFGQINHAIVFSTSRDELCRKVCQVLVEAGGARLSWVGWHRPEDDLIIPVADYGDLDGYLDNIQVSTSSDKPTGCGPSGIAFREGRASICEDMQTDPVVAPWRESIIRRGFRASAAFPIRLKGQVSGIFTVYTDVLGFFRDKEIALLEETAANISFAFDKFADEEEKAKAEARAQYEKSFSDSIVESTPGVLYLYDEQGQFLRWNRSFKTISGYSAEEISRMTPLDFFAPEERERVAERIADVFRNEEATVEAHFRSKDGTLTPYFFTGRRVVLDGRACIVGVGIDVSERKIAEDALRELNESLEYKVWERTEELTRALDRAESADRTKSAFLATMSHELRTPLNSILGFSGILLKGLAGPLNPEQHKQLSMAQGSARHLLHLINDVLDISKIEAGELEIHPKPFDVNASVERAVASLRPLADRKELTLALELPATTMEIVSDQRRVEQVLLNLINNAIKFTERGGITVSLATNASPGNIRFRVADTGIGIKRQDLGTLFKPFRQIDTGLARQREGSGLGLAICRRLSDLLGGRIEVESEWGHGSVFTFSLPVGVAS